VSFFMQENKDISSLSNFHTKAVSKYYYKFTGNIAELIQIIDFAKKNNLPILKISGWTNILFAFDVFPGIVIHFADYIWYDKFYYKNYKWAFSEVSFNYDEKTKILEVPGSTNISDIAEYLYIQNINTLWMRFIWLPGKVAGAVVGNAGCFGLETENNFLKAEVLDLDKWEIKILEKNQMKFSYRNSTLKQNKNLFVLRAWFDLSKKVEKYEFRGSLEDILNFRLNKQPSGYTCWSFFKNPSKEFPAWKLIEEVGLKWYKLGWAYFSPKHANFLMSDGTATWQDLINLKNLAQEKVFEKFGIRLEPEVNII